jgi:MFS transporter, DHA2 family, methylenomycin A resistance protein
MARYAPLSMPQPCRGLDIKGEVTGAHSSGQFYFFYLAGESIRVGQHASVGTALLFLLSATLRLWVEAHSAQPMLPLSMFLHPMLSSATALECSPTSFSTAWCPR